MFTLPPPCGPEHDWYWPAFIILVGIGLMGMAFFELWKHRKEK